MFNSDTERKRETERKYFWKVMETVQELGRQGIPFQGDYGNDNFGRCEEKRTLRWLKEFLIIQIRNSRNTAMISIKTSLLTS